jgi:hypothetical protein
MSKINFDSPASHSYLTILQDVINRMATNSSGSKTWCVALVSAILVVLADKGTPQLVWIAVIPVGLFFLLDAYYLGLERRFRNLYNIFIKKLHNDSAVIEDAFIASSPGGTRATMSVTIRAMGSFSVWPFYTVQALVLLAVRFLLVP